MGHVPSDWMPAVNMKRIHIHWTAGAHTANAVDRKSYAQRQYGGDWSLDVLHARGN